MTISKNSVRLPVSGPVLLPISFLVIFNEHGKDEIKTQLDDYCVPNQIEKLDRLAEFVAAQMTISSDQDQANCINRYFNRYKGSNYEITGISKSMQSEPLSSLSPDVFSDIWSSCKGTRSF